ncbi:MAG: NusG domain II-containing protein [Tissierellia bacterium]|nr:NusG domain II-containing protein [Tissierellia bacterium]MDD4781473.1 NusG domain II-containing protein [Tissierellia bacterium]
MKKINKYDIGLIAVIIIVNLFIIYYNAKNMVYSDKNEALIYSKNELVGKYVLDMNYKNEFTITTNNGYNTIKIEEGKIWVTDTDCPDKYCQNQGKISGVGEVIVCLPNKLLIKIVGHENKDVDIIAH